MQVAYQTIIFGPDIHNLEHVLDAIQDSGFQGVEISQRPENIRDATGRPVRLDRLLALLAERSLALVGLGGGTIGERVAYCGGITCGGRLSVANGEAGFDPGRTRRKKGASM